MSYSKAVISAICGYIELSEIPTARRSLNTTSRQSEKPNRKRLIWRFLLEAIRECTDLKELTPTIVNTLIKQIEVHNSEKGEDGLKHVPIDISLLLWGLSIFRPKKNWLRQWKKWEKTHWNPLETKENGEPHGLHRILHSDCPLEYNSHVGSSFYVGQEPLFWWCCVQYRLYII